MNKAKLAFKKLLASKRDFETMKDACIATLDAVAADFSSLDRSFFENALRTEDDKRTSEAGARLHAEQALVPVTAYMRKLLEMAIDQTIADDGRFQILEHFDEDMHDPIFSEKATQIFGIRADDASKDRYTPDAYLSFIPCGKLLELFEENNCPITGGDVVFEGELGLDFFEMESTLNFEFAIRSFKLSSKDDLDADNLDALRQSLETAHRETIAMNKLKFADEPQEG